MITTTSSIGVVPMLRLFAITVTLVIAFVVASATVAQNTTAPRSQHIEIGTDVRLHVTEAGSRTGRPVLLLHGYSDTWKSWSPILSHLPPDVRAIMPDFRGHGASSRAPTDYTITALADDVIALMVRLDLHDVTLVGHSLGSLVAQDVAVRAPARLRQLVLVGSAADPRNPAVLGLHELMASFTDSVPAAFVEEFQRSSVTRPVPSAFLDSVIVTSRQMPLHVWQGVAKGLATPPDPARLTRIAMPTHLIWGDRDGVFSRADQEALLRLIPGATLQVYDGTGHAPHWEEPARFARELVTLLDARVTGRAPSDG
jgi:non-heme chloroperoxidase